MRERDQPGWVAETPEEIAQKREELYGLILDLLESQLELMTAVKESYDKMRGLVRQSAECVKRANLVLKNHRKAMGLEEVKGGEKSE